MSLSRDSLEIRQLKAIRRAQIGLKQRLERIRWEEEVLIPEVEAALGGRSVLGLNAGDAFEIVVEDATDRPRQTPKRARRHPRR